MNTGAGYYDDNFGWWEMNDEEDLRFYERIQASNVRKRCQGCGRLVSIQPRYAYCNECATKIEHGWDI